jgi:hypothetical protein
LTSLVVKVFHQVGEQEAPELARAAQTPLYVFDLAGPHCRPQQPLVHLEGNSRLLQSQDCTAGEGAGEPVGNRVTAPEVLRHGAVSGRSGRPDP